MGRLPDSRLLPDVMELPSLEPGSVEGAAAASSSLSLGASNPAGGSNEALPSKASSQIHLGMGLPSIAKRIVDKIVANEYIDFANLPPAKGKTKHIPQSLEGQIVVVQAADLFQQRRLIPDFATWAQCFAIFTAVISGREPNRVADLMAYLSIIAKASLKYKWPSWVVYDQNFRQDAADQQNKIWARVDPGIYAQCFTNMAISMEGWCKYCHSVEHASDACPMRQHLSRKRPWQPQTATAPPTNPPLKKMSADVPVCIKYNKFGGDCQFGIGCRFRHVCRKCWGPHPQSACPQVSGPPKGPAESKQD